MLSRKPAMPRPRFTRSFNPSTLWVQTHGELIALEWGDLDWRARTVLVQRNFTHGELEDTPKSGHSRTVDLTPQTVTALRLLRRQLHRESFQHGLSRPELVFPSTEGTHFDESNARNVMRAICDKAELRRRSPHDMRHTFATLLLQENAPIAYVSKQLGHADPAITLKVYTHWLPKSGDRPEVAKLDALSESVARSLQTAARAADRRSA